MVRRFLAVATLLWTAAAQPALAQARLPAPLEAYIAEAMRQSETPGVAVALVNGEEPPIAQGFGIRRLGRPERVDADTVFNIASLAKSFTAAGAAALVDDGRLRWNDAVHR
jgi:CubicO group peptidase (beta-lactamase class C family)